MTIRYAEGGQALDVRLIASWKRGFMPGPIMSNSSGPRDYLKNDIWAFFNANPNFDEIVMVRASGPPFLLARSQGYWFDMAGKQVIRSMSSDGVK